MFKYLLLIFSASVLFSCTPYRNLVYLKPDGEKEVESFIIDSVPAYKIQVGDEIAVDFTSTVATQIEIFNKKFENQTEGYLVNSKGEIEMPLVGTIKVSGLTLEEVHEEIKKSLSNYIDYVTIKVRLSSYSITFLGEVKKPGTFQVARGRINIFEALGLAGDITEMGNRKKIKIIRKTQTGADIFVLNLQSKEILNSPHYYLRPDDIVYVEPLKTKVISANKGTLQLTISLITLTFIIVRMSKLF